MDNIGHLEEQTETHAAPRQGRKYVKGIFGQDVEVIDETETAIIAETNHKSKIKPWLVSIIVTAIAFVLALCYCAINDPHDDGMGQAFYVMYSAALLVGILIVGFITTIVLLIAGTHIKVEIIDSPAEQHTITEEKPTETRSVQIENTRNPVKRQTIMEEKLIETYKTLFMASALIGFVLLFNCMGVILNQFTRPEIELFNDIIFIFISFALLAAGGVTIIVASIRHIVFSLQQSIYVRVHILIYMLVLILLAGCLSIPGIFNHPVPLVVASILYSISLCILSIVMLKKLKK